MSLVVSVAGKALAAVAANIDQLVADKVASRIAAKDFTLWGKDAEAESSIRLGWVNSAVDSQALVEGILALRDEFHDRYEAMMLASTQAFAGIEPLLALKMRDWRTVATWPALE